MTAADETLRQQRHILLLLASCVVMVWINTGIALSGYPNHDFAVFLTLAIEAVERGRHYYVDLYEFNPPIFLHLAEAIVRLAKLTDASVSATSSFFFSALTVLCLAVLWPAARRLTALPHGGRLMLVGLVCAMVTIGAGASHSQRDVVAFQAMLPAVIWWAAGGASSRQGIAPGLLLGFAATIRPTVVLLPVCLAAIDAVRLRSARPFFTSVNLTAAAVSILYIALTLPVLQAYFDNIMPLLQALRRGFLFSSMPEPALLLKLVLGALVCLGMTVAALRDTLPADRPPQMRRLLVALAVMLAVCIAAAYAFGFADYRVMPIAGAMALMFFASAFLVRDRIPKATGTIVYALLGLVLFTSFPTVLTQPALRPRPLDQLMSKAGAVAYAPLTNSVLAQFLVDHPLHMASLANSLGMVYELWARAGDPTRSAEIKALQARIEQEFLDRTIDMIERDKPEFLFVEFSLTPSPAPVWWPKDQVFSFAGWLCQDARFRAVWPAYEPVVDIEAMRIYKRRDHAISPEMQAEADRLRRELPPHRLAHNVDCENGPRP